MEPIKKYCCTQCSNEHDYEHDALTCCAPEIVEVYYCGHCGEDHDADREGAVNCCADKGDDLPPFVSKRELEQAGQLRLVLPTIQ